jgi:hypothetical protein
VDGKVACEATLTCQVVPRERRAPSSSATDASPEEDKAPEAVGAE